MRKFEIVEKYKNSNIDLMPKRATRYSAGYDLVAAEDVVIPSMLKPRESNVGVYSYKTAEVGEVKKVCEDLNHPLPTLVPTGVKAEMNEGECLTIFARSSMPYKNLLIIANGVGLVDSDYYNNSENEGHIFVQFVNLSPEDILIKAGTRIAQAVFLAYGRTNEDSISEFERGGGFGSTGNK